jgi:DNA-binding protein HU-beta
VDAIFDPDPNLGLIAAELKNGSKVAISGFGTFEARERKERTGRNPHTGEAVNIPPRALPPSRPGSP